MSQQTGDPAPRRPNILFLFTDDQRFDTLSALGNETVETPNIDRLVSRGTSFTHCCIQGSLVPAVCICSRAQLISGRSLYRAPVTPTAADGLSFWPETFRQHGYQTFGTGKWHNGPWAYSESFTAGGSIFYGGMSDHLAVPVHDFDPSGTYAKSGQYVGKKFSSELFSDAAVSFLENYSAEDPFFAYVSYTAPHDPRMAPDAFEAKYPRDRIPVPANLLPQHPFDNGELKIRDELLAPFPRTPEIAQEHLAAYYAMITHLDAHLGRVLDALERSGQADNTIVIFAADNGLAVGQHGLLGKQNLYDHSVRVPLIISGPGLPQGRTCDALVYLYELFATTCDLVGIETPETVETGSLKPLLTGTAEHHHESVFAGYRHLQRMVRTERYKLIRYPYIDRVQLFDLEADPLELNDLSGQAEYRQVLSELDERLRAWQSDVGDPLDLDHLPPWPSEGRACWPAADGSFALLPQDAERVGAIEYRPEHGDLTGWTDPDEFPAWRMLSVGGGTYRVELTYGCERPGVPLSIQAGEYQLTAETIDTGGAEVYCTVELGSLELRHGQAQVALRAANFAGSLLSLRRLSLIPE